MFHSVKFFPKVWLANSKRLLFESHQGLMGASISQIGFAKASIRTTSELKHQTFETPTELLCRDKNLANGTISVMKRELYTSTSLCQNIPKSRALTIIKELREVKHSPAPALALGLSGLIPFVLAPVYMIFSQAFSPVLAFVQIAYGATILSFLGGVRWGLTLPEDSVVKPDWTNLGYSVVPSLVAWVGLLLPEPLSIFILMGGLGAAAYFDTMMYGYPLWFKGLRFVLSFVAIISLWTTFMCKYMIADKDKLGKEKDEKQQ